MITGAGVPMIEVRPEVRASPPPVHGGPCGSRDELYPVHLDFSASLNAWGAAPEVIDAIRGAGIEDYPDPEALGARAMVAAHWGCALEEVIIGAGAAELIHSISLAFLERGARVVLAGPTVGECARGVVLNGAGAGAAELIHSISFAFLERGARVVIAGPTFGEYARAVVLNGAEAVEVRAAEPEWRADIDEVVRRIVEVRPRLVFLCTPNNPTGAALTHDEVEGVADAVKGVGGLLVLDQSYDAFTTTPLGTPALRGHPAIISLRSLTKDHALAGVRVALAIGPARLISSLERARPPWSVSSRAQAAVVAALSPEGDRHLARTLPRLREERVRIEARLAEIGVPTVPSTTHYLMVEVGDADRVEGELRREYAIGVRSCASFGLPGHIRIAARRPEENDQLLYALRSVCSS